ncbi:MAG: Ig-like domain-containing protein [Nitrospirales bacterium]
MSNSPGCPTFIKVFLASVFVGCLFLVPDTAQSSTSSFPPPIVTPAPGATLTSSTVTFTGAHSSEDTQHWVYVGSTSGANDYYAGGVNGSHQFTVSGLPSSGAIYVKYFSRTCSTCTWQHQLHAYTMGSGGVSNNSVMLQWAANSESDLAGYKVYQGTTPGSYGSAIEVGNTTVYTAQNLKDGLTYYFAVAAHDTSGNESAPSIEVSKLITDPQTDTTPPSVSLTAPSQGSTLSGVVTLTATATDNVGVVGVRFQLNGVNFGAEDTTNPYSVSWDTTGIAAGQYSLSAIARDATGNSTTSTPVSVTVEAPRDSTPPSVPGTLTTQVISSSEISLNWLASTDNVGITGYHIFRNGAFITSTSITSYKDAKLAPLTTYAYTVTAWDAAGNESMPSTSVSATTQAPPDTTPPSIPTGMAGTILSNSEIALSWDTSTDNVQVAGYQVMKNNVLLATTMTPSYRDSGLSSGFTYTYTVKAYDQAGNTSGLSKPVSLTLPPSTATLKVSVVGNGMVTSSPNGISCSSHSCSASYGNGSTVTLTANPEKRWKFTGWSGACSGTGECVIQLLNDQVVKAEFAENGKGAGGGGRKK